MTDWATKWIERCKVCRFSGKEGELITCRRRGTCKFIEKPKVENLYECKTCGRKLPVLEMRKQAYKNRIYFTMCKECYNTKARANRQKRIEQNAGR